MSVKKQYLKSRPVSKVTFHLPCKAAPAARNVYLVGEFNGWDTQAMPMKKLKTGAFTLTIELAPGRTYSYRYLIDGKVWENDWDADAYLPSGVAESDNSVVEV